MPGDLHNHTTFSDGSCKAEMLPHLAAAAGLGWVAITDHDSMAGVRYCYEHPKMYGVRLMPGLELSGYDYARGRRVHILCYWPRADYEPLIEHCRTMTRRRREAVGRSMDLLEERCPQFRRQDALAFAADSEGQLFKSHVMRAMMEYGLAEEVYGAAYKRLFKKYEEGGIAFSPAYEDCRSLFRLARESGGVVVLAHPSVYHSLELAGELAAEGLLDGIEIDHPRNTAEDRGALEVLAARYDLIVTGGTDFHGINRKVCLPVGSGQASDGMIERINALAAERKQK